MIFALELLYYVALELDRVLENLQRYLRGNGRLLFTYYFPEKAWTKRYIPSREARLERLMRFFVCDEFIDVNPKKEGGRVLVGLLSEAPLPFLRAALDNSILVSSENPYER